MALIYRNGDASIANTLSTNRNTFLRKKYPSPDGRECFNRKPINMTANTILVDQIENASNGSLQSNVARIGSFYTYFGVMGLYVLFGAISVPFFHVGLLVGLSNFLIKIPLILLLTNFFPKKETDSNSYSSGTDLHLLLYTSLTAPILEEVIFRGVFQPALLALIGLIIPASTSFFILPGLSAATLTAVFITATAFGLVHAFNDHPGAYQQAFHASISGIVLGLLAVYFSLPVAIAAHVTNNTMAVLLTMSTDISSLMPKIFGHSDKVADDDISEYGPASTSPSFTSA